MSTDLPNSHRVGAPDANLLVAAESLSLSTADSLQDRRKAWHLFSLLLSVGAPTPLVELASRCTRFRASPEFIKFLCSIPDSPISLAGNNLYVTFSLNSLSAFVEHLSNFSYTIDVLPPGVRDLVRESFRKRKRVVFYSGDDDDDDDDQEGEEEKEEQAVVPLLKRIRKYCDEGSFHLIDNISKSRNTQFSEMSIVRKMTEQLIVSELDLGSASSSRVLDHDIHVKSAVNLTAAYCLEDVKQSSISQLKVEEVDDASEATKIRITEDKRIVEDEEKKSFKEQPIPLDKVDILDMPLEIDFESTNRVNCNDMMPSLSKEPPTTEELAVFPAILEKQLSRPSVKVNAAQMNTVVPEVQDMCKSVGQSKVVNCPQEKQQCKGDYISISITPKSMQNHNDMQHIERKGTSTSLSSKDPNKQKMLPDFESYIVEEEEGSGGYGTVYRARKKSDGTTVAIKCPHANAHKHHINNELRMLERFGGKSFVIKYEGCFKNGNSDCFVLQHVEHDRPEVLKKEIDVFQLQWYGYCMFRALASLHKQGVVHRDVKPGNFLFSCKTNKGYLIDFNLAMDLRQKYKTIYKSKAGNDLSSTYGTLCNAKSVPPANGIKFPTTKPLNNHGTTKGSTSTLAPKNLKKVALGERKAPNQRNQFNSQGADGSGITSAKDVTSTRTPSAERLREPLPCQGRKELISLLQEAMMSANHEVSHVPAPMRKRVAASPGKIEKELFLTPMPLYSTGCPVAGAGFMKNKGDGKHKKEGPCVGTKGFRAPEVCFRSPYQGPKIDIWSAGVTLLYLIIGRMPFCGDPEQNIKDIAKLRGSEDVWEVAKLHNRESSFPMELYDTQYLPSVDIKEWCQVNTKRRDILEVIPNTFFDLVDKCLTVNPRLRISAEDALKHEFFAPFHESLRKQKLLRQEQSLGCGTNLPLHGKGIRRLSKIPHEQA